MRQFPLNPLAASLLLHGVALLAALTLRWEAGSPRRLAREVALVAPLAPPKRRAPEAPAQPAARRKGAPPERAERAARRFQPPEPAPRLPDTHPVEAAPPAAPEIPPPVLLSLPAPAEIPARPVAAIKLGNLSSAAAVAPGQARADLENARTAFGFATVQRPEPLPEQRVRPAAFGDVSFGAAKPAEKNPPRPAAITPVEILFKPRPEYTEEALRLRLEGEVVLEVRFTAAGAAEVLRLVRGLGHGLDEAAGRAARAIRFRPAMQSGQPVDTTALVHILFELAY